MLKTPIADLPATSGRTISRLKSLGLRTFEDLLNHFPSRYENYALVSAIRRLQPGEKATIKGMIVSGQNQLTRSGRTMQKILIDDGTSTIEAVWYNQPYLLRLLRTKTLVSVAGAVEWFGKSPVLVTQQYEILHKPEDETIHTGRIIPIYPETYGLSSKTLREKIWHLLKKETPQEFFPPAFVKKYQLFDEVEAYRQIHFPANRPQAEDARARLAFDEVATIQLSSAMIRQEWQKQKAARRIFVNQDRLDEFVKSLPFKLTSAQKRALAEILSDLEKTTPMNRLLQGEVGSGKTVVAAAAAYMTFLNRSQTLLMAPTEILAFQHHQTLTQLFAGGRLTNAPKIALYTSSSKPKPAILKAADVIVGTHALIDQKMQFANVGLAVIDEQHKFGVAQRGRLKEKGVNPHLLTMTATPIPRTVLLTFYGELDLSVIDEMPQNRLMVKTHLVPAHKRPDAYAWMRKQIKKKGVQAFIVCPLIENSESETLAAVRAVKKEFRELQQKIFPDLKLGLLHGKMKSKEKDAVMREFGMGKIDILVSTPVVEVGIDVPAAAIIVIEAAERFGLAQLHQLRGRVGRGERQSYCLLFTEKNPQTVSQRLRVFTACFNGFELAVRDLGFRGGGQMYGAKQHGKPDFKLASFTDFKLMTRAQAAVGDFLRQYRVSDFPLLQNRLENYKISLIGQD